MKGVIFGPLGAGKGVQCRKLEERMGIRHVETGSILRKNANMETPYGTPREYIDEGEYVPDRVMNRIVEQVLDGEGSFLLDGYPRTMDQARYLSSKRDLDVMIYMHIDEETTLHRLTGRKVCSSCGESFHDDYKPPDVEGRCDACGSTLTERSDDVEETIHHRMEVYEEETVPVIEHYRERLDVIDIDAERPHDVVWEEFAEKIEPYV